MIPDAGETIYRRLPILPDEWRKIGPRLCEGIDADYLLIDTGPSTGEPRYMIVGLGSPDYSLHFCDRLTQAHRPRSDGGLDVKSLLMIPLPHARDRQFAHIGMLRMEEKPFSPGDIVHLRTTGERLLSLLAIH
jgi:hypothetical protein